MSSELLSRREGDLLILTISGPGRRNALSPEVYSAGTEAVETAGSDDSIRAIILTGDGEHFCAGGDLQRLKQVREAGPDAKADSVGLLHGWIESMRACPKPLIAAVEGHAAGAGMSLALACDLLVASRGAQFTMSYGRIGLTPDGGGSWQLARRLPRPLALELIWLAKPVDAPRLHQLGLVNQLTEPGHALPGAVELGRALAAMAPNALEAGRELVDAAPTHPLQEHLAMEHRLFLRNLFDQNAGEGVQAFLERRPAHFR